jgi:hypothetical protein
MPRKDLTDEHKIYIVRRLAAYETLTSIARGLKREFGITVSRALVETYNPVRSSGRKLGRRWKDLFWKARKAFKEGIADVGANYPLVRIYWRGEMALEMWDAGQHKVANELLDSIAKEGASVPDESTGQGHFGLSDGPLTATVNIVHRHEPAPAPEAARPVRKRND